VTELTFQFSSVHFCRLRYSNDCWRNWLVTGSA